MIVTVLMFACCARAHAVSWFAFGPDGGSARTITADPRDSTHLYLGAANGWIFQSRDGGKTWQRLSRVDDRDDLVIDNILVDSENPRRLIIGAWVLSDLSHPDGGLYISEDGGKTWVSQPDMRGQSIRALAAAPSDRKIFVAGSIEGVFRSTDSGAHWQRISPKDNAEIHEIESLAIDPSDPNVIYAGTWHLPWKTTDGGATWTSIKEGIIEDSDVFSIIVDPKQPSVVYLSACSGIYKSEDGGAKFTGGVGQNGKQGIPSDARRTRVLMQDPNHLDTVFAGTTEGLYRTFDAGKHWAQTTSADVVVNDVYVDSANSKHVLLATDRRGVLVSDDGGDNFVPSNAGFSARQITAFTQDAKHPSVVYVGVVNDKDSGGVFVSSTGGLSWSQLGNGLEGNDVNSLAQAPDGTILAGTGHGIFLLKDAVWHRSGETEKASPMAGAASGAKTAAALRARPAATRQVAGKRAAAKAPAVKKLDGSVYGFVLTGNTLYAATSQGLLRSDNSGAAWSGVMGIPADDWHFVAAAKKVIAVASLNENQTSSLEVSTDGGGKWRAVTLPTASMQVLALAVDGDGGLWIGDRDAVYMSTDDGASWQAETKLAIRNVSDLYFDERDNRILVAARAPGKEAFAVDVGSGRVTTWDTGWNLRFVRPVGSYLVGATLFDGMVVQPRMVDSADLAKH
ncbi:MAG TPA: hypothetical protein VGU23_04195 [Acidobacteriaceae bacterium]|nr:hypothetical protein [Acidobacteriaceae bacterium]